MMYQIEYCIYSSNLSLLLAVPRLLLQLAPSEPPLNYRRLPLALLECVQVRLDVFLEFVGAFVVDGLRLVIDPAVLEDPDDVLAEVLAVSVLVVRQLLLDGL